MLKRKHGKGAIAPPILDDTHSLLGLSGRQWNTWISLSHCGRLPSPMSMVRRKKIKRAKVNVPSDKRTKRPPRGQSPAVTSTTITPAINGLQKITLPARNSVGPSSNLPFSREPKARREALAAQLPLQDGRKVAFHPPTGSGTNAPTDESTWILAVVTKCINQDKNRSVLFLRPILGKVFDLTGILAMQCRTQSHRRTDNPECKRGNLLVSLS